MTTADAARRGAVETADVIVVGAGPGGLHDRVLPGQGRPGRPAAGEDRVPAREGLRRRAHPACGPSSSSPWASTSPEDAAGCATRACGSSAAGIRLELRLARPRRVPDYGLVRKRDRLRRACWPVRPRRPAPGCTSAATSPARCWTTVPAGSSASRAKRRRRGEAPGVTFRAPLVVAADGNSTRLVARDGPAPARGPPDGRRRADVLHLARATTTTTWSRGWSCGTTRDARRPPAARLRLDLRHGRRHVQRRPRHPQLLAGLRRTGLREVLKAGARHARGVGLHATRT